jgi:hypothetical protein
MRRLVANALLLLCAVATILPCLLEALQDNLPACCRRGGQHHCAMMAAVSSTGPSLHAISDQCPLYPRATFVARNHTASPQATRSLFASIVWQPVLLAPADARHLTVNTRSHHKRGPPHTI